jgi:hypothetical protein
VDVLIHQREVWRPTSTGRLIHRVVENSRTFLHQRGSHPDPKAIVDPSRELWILHPRGIPLEAAPQTDPKQIQVLLLDGNWTESGEMLRAVENWGRRVSLPLTGSSRYWLREQRHEAHHSTIEALLGLFRVLGLHEAEHALRLQFELHVYASLRARGHKPLATEYLASSPIQSALPEFLATLEARRPNLLAVPKHKIPVHPADGQTDDPRTNLRPKTS